MKRRRIRAGARALAAAVALAACPTALAQGAPEGRAPAPPRDLVAADHPWDAGEWIDLTWERSADDPGSVVGYKVYRSLTEAEVVQAEAEVVRKAVQAAKQEATEAVLAAAGLPPGAELGPELRSRIRQARRQAIDDAQASSAFGAAERAFEAQQFKLLTIEPAGTTSVTVEKLDRSVQYRFRVVAAGPGGIESAAAETAGAVSPTRQAFDGSRLFLAIITAILCGAVVLYIHLARRGIPLKVRKIPGLEAVTEAVGRATEMGRPALFIPGIQDMNDIQTIAGITILAHVAEKAAEYDARIEVPTSRSLVMTTAREAVQAAYLAAGRPDAYNEDLIYYVTDEQFGYVAYVSGHMVREKPAACFYMGAFFAESLILAETGNSIGAIQVAGTAQPAQLPFFVAACDYTLIGEEFFAASAYLSGKPDQLGSLKGQDVGKVVVAAIVIFGVACATAANLMDADGLRGVVDFLKSVVLA